jgi:hypothetical protein
MYVIPQDIYELVGPIFQLIQLLAFVDKVFSNNTGFGPTTPSHPWNLKVVILKEENHPSKCYTQSASFPAESNVHLRWMNRRYYCIVVIQNVSDQRYQNDTGGRGG